MARTKISEFSATPGNNTDIDGINIAEGCAPSGINDAIRELMSQLKDWQSGASNDPMVIGSSGSLTLSYGTANGVTYLNGSKVLTSGSSLVFDGTNLGVGTSSTLGNSTVNAVLGFAARNSGATPGYFQTYNSNAGTDLKTWRFGGDSSGNFVLQTVNDAYSSATTRLTVDNVGNLGLGVTPSAWTTNSSVRALQFGGGSVYSFNNDRVFIGQNVAITGAGADTYINSAAASTYRQFQGAHAWYTAPSGTAGNAISFTQAMTLDASGNLLVGTTSASGLAASGRGLIEVNGSTDSAVVLKYGNTIGGYLYSDSSTMRVAAGGTSPLILWTNSAERARIDSSGNFAIGGTTTYGFRLGVESASGSPTCYFARNTSTTTDIVLQVTSNVGAAGSTRLVIRASGNVENSNNSYGALSDIKLKENVTDATPKLEKLQQVRVVNYNLIGSEQKQLGVIAQELEQIFPGMIDESPDRDAEGNDLGTTTKSVKYSVFVPMLIKAMQEQQAIIEQLKADVAALKG